MGRAKHVDYLDRKRFVVRRDPAIGAHCESIAAIYPDTTSIDLVSSKGTHYRETPCAKGYAYHQFYQWTTPVIVYVNPRTGERLTGHERHCGYLPIFISPVPLGGMVYDERNQLVERALA